MIVAIAQINTTIGDFEANGEKITSQYREAVQKGAELVVFPELAIPGYPPRDLLLKTDFVERNLDLLHRLAAVTGDAAMLVGFVGKSETRPGRALTNSAALLQNGKIVAERSKTLLPTYDVFDEDRYFEPARKNEPMVFKGKRIGITICEDVWNDKDLWNERRYSIDPAAVLASSGVDLIVNLSASPWSMGKSHVRRNLLRNLAVKSRCPVIYCNLVGGNDELIFDGNSLALDAQGRFLAEGKFAAEELVLIDLDTAKPIDAPPLKMEEELYHALSLGLRDYLHKCHFHGAVLGLSGGIDSAVVACLAAEALGPENVHGISLPSEFSSQGSLDDGRVLAENLGIRYDVVSIQPIFESAKKQLSTLFAGKAEDTTEENMQARIRGLLLMANSNKFGSLLLTTGNKSELGVGYCTLYGDMCGGLAVISDVPKTAVYKLAKWINREREIIPDASITKPPSAELRPNQTDQDSLPDYEILDAILDLYVVEQRSTAEIIARGFDKKAVEKVIRLIDRSEYKRRQAAPGLKATTKAFGVGRRFPVAQNYKE